VCVCVCEMGCFVCDCVIMCAVSLKLTVVKTENTHCNMYMCIRVAVCVCVVCGYVIMSDVSLKHIYIHRYIHIYIYMHMHIYITKK